MPIDAPIDPGSPSTTGKQRGLRGESATVTELVAVASSAATAAATAAAAAAAAVRAIESGLANRTSDPAPAGSSLLEETDGDIPNLTTYDDDPLKKAIEVERYRLDIADAMLGCLHAFFEADLSYDEYHLAPPDPAFVVVEVRKLLKKSISGLDSRPLNRLIDAARTNAAFKDLPSESQEAT